jgi:alpha-tubulin suppressor-like RCC1 family protein
VVPGIAGARVRPTNDHTCAVTADGNAWCWGDGGVGALGNGAEVDTPLPSAVLFDH